MGAALEGAVGVGLDPLPDGPAVQISGEPVAVQPELGGIAPQVGILQGLFWPMHQLLFDHQQALTDQDLQGDADSALESGAGGTPTLFINRRLHLGGYDQATLSAALATAINQQ